MEGGGGGGALFIIHFMPLRNRAHPEWIALCKNKLTYKTGKKKKGGKENGAIRYARTWRLAKRREALN